MPERENPAELVAGLPPAPYREPPIVRSAPPWFNFPRLRRRRRHTLCCGHNVEDAFADLQDSSANHQKRTLIQLNRKFVAQVQHLLDHYSAGQLPNFEEVMAARDTLVRMHNMSTRVRVSARVSKAVDYGMNGVSGLSDSKWNDPSMRPTAIAFLQALRCQFSSHSF